MFGFLSNLWKRKPSPRPDYLDQDKNTILVIDDYLPCYDRSSGSKRLYELVKLFRNMNLNVIFLPEDGLPAEPYYSELKGMGVHILVSEQQGRQLNALKQVIRHVDYAWISRPTLNRKYQSLIRKNSAAKIIFDTVDLHYIRMLRQADTEGSDKLRSKALKVKQLELKLARDADATLVVTGTEKEILQREGIERIWVVPNVHRLADTTRSKPFEERSGLVFIGGYKHTPNVDAVKWLVEEIMPIVWKEAGDIPVYLLGSDAPAEVQALTGPQVSVPGYLHDVSDYFRDARIFAAPLRYGAGMKGKIGQSLEFRLPVVSTGIGTEGMNLEHEVNVLTADTAAGFARQIIRLYGDAELWNTLHRNSAGALNAYLPETVQHGLQELFDSMTDEHNEDIDHYR